MDLTDVSHDMEGWSETGRGAHSIFSHHATLVLRCPYAHCLQRACMVEAHGLPSRMKPFRFEARNQIRGH